MICDDLYAMFTKMQKNLDSFFLGRFRVKTRVCVGRSRSRTEWTSVKENSWRIKSAARHEPPLLRQRRYYVCPRIMLGTDEGDASNGCDTSRPMLVVTYTRPPCSRFLFVGRVYWQEVGRFFWSAFRLFIKEKMDCITHEITSTILHTRREIF